MKIVKQKKSLPILNLDVEEDKRVKKHGDLLPSSIRCIISGPSNSGKTNVMITLVKHENGLRFFNLYVYSKSLFQPKYKFLKEILRPIKGLGYYEFNENDKVISPSEAKPHSIFIFDDIACDKQGKIQQFFSMGRHKGIDCFYLSQTYAKIPKHLIRDNINFLILFKQDALNINHVFQDHVSGDMNLEKFKNICSKCWDEPHGFLVIDKDSGLNEGRYRKGFDAYICP